MRDTCIHGRPECECGESGQLFDAELFTVEDYRLARWCIQVARDVVGSEDANIPAGIATGLIYEMTDLEKKILEQLRLF